MIKKSIRTIVAAILVLIILIFGTIFSLMIRDGVNPVSYIFKRSQVEITASSQIYSADINPEKSGNYYGLYKSYDKNDEYDLYIIPFKIVNNSDFIVTNLKLNNDNQDNFIIDIYGDNYFLDYECPFAIYPNSTGFVSGLISVKKGISDKELKEIIKDIDKGIVLQMGVEYKTDNGTIISPVYTLNTKFDITDEIYDKKSVKTHLMSQFF